MEVARQKARLVAFLGKAEYKTTRYQWGRGEGSHISCYATAALCRMLQQEGIPPDEVVILCTDEAWTRHGEPLSAEIRNLIGLPPERKAIPNGENPGELWQQFDMLRQEFRVPEDTLLVLDITNGFRSQPFFAAAALSFVRAVDDRRPEVRVFYAGNLVEDRPTDVWELTAFTELVDWAQALSLFLKTGRVAGVAEPARRLGRDLRKQWALQGQQGPKPGLDRLAEALKNFGEALVTVRTGDLLLGREEEVSASRNLMSALDDSEEEVRQYLPPLADVLDRIRRFAAPLARTDSLKGPEGDAALAALARLYLDMQRYSEAATTVREAWVTRYASPQAATPGRGFSRKARMAAEGDCYRNMKGFETLAMLRNDIDHGGMNDSPRVADRLIKEIGREVEHLQATAGQPPPVRERDRESSIFLNLSNHPSDLWDEGQRAAAATMAPRVVDIPFPEVPPDLDEQGLIRLADRVLERIPAETTHAMVQGEFTLTHLLVERLERRGITCVAATSRRDVQADKDGSRVVRFRFVRFRRYSRPD